MGVAGLMITACATAPAVPTKPLPAPVQPAPAKPKQPLTNKDIVVILLREAERALEQEHLTTPEHDNAYDRYLAVLQLDPGNQQATGGVQLIGQRYLALARSALAGSSIASAKRYLNRAQQILGENTLVAQLRNQIRQTEKTMRAPVQAAHDANVIALPSTDLSHRDDLIKARLAEVAKQARDTDMAILIVARNDAEGRWIYKQMREAVEGYRLRGDIKIGHQPLIRLLPPMNEGLSE